MTDSLHELIELDKQGFVLPPGVDPQEHLDGGKRTLEWAHSIHDHLAAEGETEVMGARFSTDQQLSGEVMKQCLTSARQTYRINPDWVPAFYTNEHLPWYVGGASFYGTTHNVFQVCFVLREGFRDKSRWLIYDRAEIASHEACHVARSSFGQDEFEEPLAYAISPSRLRRNLGGMFTGQWEALALLMSSSLLIAGSIIDMLWAPSWVRWLSAIPLIVTGVGLSARATITSYELRRAQKMLQPHYGDNTSAVVFRCTDEEIKDLSRAHKTSTSLEQWMNDRRDSLRWQVIKARFGNNDETEDMREEVLELRNEDTICSTQN